jgi:hypothetical protein
LAAGRGVFAVALFPCRMPQYARPFDFTARRMIQTGLSPVKIRVCLTVVGSNARITRRLFVIPAKAGIQWVTMGRRLRGDDGKCAADLIDS